VALQVLSGRVRDFPEAALRVVLAGLDPTTALANAEAHALYDGKSLVAFCAVKDHGSIRELGNVYTVPRFRGQGHASTLLRHVLGKHGTLHLFCRPRLIRFYERHGFSVVPGIPQGFGLRKAYMQVFAALGLRHVVMARRVSP
jgi:GNAT superfamily N-acetyltransferase